MVSEKLVGQLVEVESGSSGWRITDYTDTLFAVVLGAPLKCAFVPEGEQTDEGA